MKIILDDMKNKNLSLNSKIETKRYFNTLFSLRFQDLSTHPYVAPILLQQFTQAIYEHLCENIGPVATDKIYGVSISQTSQLPEAMFFSPQNLLN